MASEQKTSNTINIILWIAQVLLASLFLWQGVMKLVNPASLPWPWMKDHPDLVLLTGTVDLLAAIGLILPALLRIQTRLTIYAAYGTIALMIVASIFHIARGETQIMVNFIVASIAAFIAWGRQKKAPIKAR